MFCKRIEGGQFELPHHADEAAGTGVIGADQRQDIAFHFNRAPRIGEDDRQQLAVEFTGLADMHVRNEGAFLERGIGLGRHANAANVDDVTGGGEEGDELFSQEYRRHHHIVEQVPGAEPRVIGDEDIAGLHRGLREMLEEMLDGGGHGVDVARCSRHRLGNHVALRIIDTGRQIASLARDGAERRAEQRLRLFLDDGDQPVPHHLGADGGECVLAHRRRSRTM